MTSTASILNDFGIPWPDADTANAREAAVLWVQLASVAQDALSQGTTTVRSLCASNTGAAMDAFSQYWDAIGGSAQTAKLPLLIECCEQMAKICNEFADAVDDARHTLEETAAEMAAAIAGGAVLTIFTFGVSDAVGDAAAAALVPGALATVRVLGMTVEELVSTLVGSAAMSTFDAMFEQLTSTAVGIAFGESAESAGSNATDLAWGTLLGTVGGAIGASTVNTSVAAVNALGATYAEELSSLDARLPGIVAAIPDALDTPAGKTLVNLASASAATAVTGRPTDPPSLEDILGELIDSKIESAADKAGEAGEGEGKPE